jgi:hypothetical protein
LEFLIAYWYGQMVQGSASFNRAHQRAITKLAADPSAFAAADTGDNGRLV